MFAISVEYNCDSDVDDKFNSFINYCFFAGGYDGNDFLSTVECYDPDKNEWMDVCYMTCGRSGHGVAVGAEPIGS